MALRKFLDSIEPEFEKGGRLERWYAVYEAIDTILYTPGKVTVTSSHVRDA
ncbi:MAG: NADH:ubiquinone reductase (Na(+)-transporting) subunit B, partial [Pseudomonadales bacterium]|nr:NADH:ubiquinone reductase (Na(+)-transporting) subunit B [Pseudomonadales bacterium]